MRVASDSPRPYLLNQAGGTCPVREFSLVGDQLKLVPAAEKPLAGEYHLVYRCPEHENWDVKRAVRSDGENWSVVDKPPAHAEFDVCFPAPSN